MGVWWAHVSVCSCGGGVSKISSQFAKKVASPSFAICANPLTKTGGAGLQIYSFRLDIRNIQKYLQLPLQNQGGYKYIALGVMYVTPEIYVTPLTKQGGGYIYFA